MYQIGTVAIEGREVRIPAQFEREGSTLARGWSYLLQPDRACWIGLRIRTRVELGGPVPDGPLAAELGAAVRKLAYFPTASENAATGPRKSLAAAADGVSAAITCHWAPRKRNQATKGGAIVALIASSFGLWLILRFLRVWPLGLAPLLRRGRPKAKQLASGFGLRSPKRPITPMPAITQRGRIDRRPVAVPCPS